MRFCSAIVTFCFILLVAGCATDAIDVRPLEKYQALKKGTAVSVVSYLDEGRQKTGEQKGEIEEMNKDCLVLWCETEGGWMGVLYPGRFVKEIKVLREVPNHTAEAVSPSRAGSP